MLGPRKTRDLDRPVLITIESYLPQDHFYRHLHRVLDLSFVHDLVADRYAVGGRPSIDPEVFFRLQLMMFFAGQALELRRFRGSSVEWFIRRVDEATQGMGSKGMGYYSRSRSSPTSRMNRFRGQIYVAFTSTWAFPSHEITYLCYHSGMDENGPTEKPNYPIESVDKALRLLRLLRDRKSLTIKEASEAIGAAPSTAHRLLAMLKSHGFATQDAISKVYTAGPTLLEVGLAAVRQMDIRSQARPFMEKLVLEVGETVHLVIRQETSILFLQTVESSKALRVTDRTGMFVPAHCTAAGKALLAELPQELLLSLYPHTRLPEYAPRSLQLRSDLLRELRVVRERGYATNFDEGEPGVSAVASVIRDPTPRIRAAITVAAPISRLDEDQVTRIAEATIRATVAIGEVVSISS